MVGGSDVAKHRNATLTTADRGELDVNIAAPRLWHADVHRHRVLGAVAAATVDESGSQKTARPGVKDADLAAGQRLQLAAYLRRDAPPHANVDLVKH